jgi:hypothetical protein
VRHDGLLHCVIPIVWRLARFCHPNASSRGRNLLHRFAMACNLHMQPGFFESRGIGARGAAHVLPKETAMPLLIALAISIGVLAVAATWLFLGPLAAMDAQIWQAFVAWACFFHCGGKMEGAQKTAVCMVFGAVVGALSVMLAGQLGALGPLAAPVAVGIGAAAAVLGAHIGLLATIPATVYGFACVAGLILLKGLTPVGALTPTIVSIVIGAGFGYLSEMLAGKLAKPVATEATSPA